MWCKVLTANLHGLTRTSQTSPDHTHERTSFTLSLLVADALSPPDRLRPPMYARTVSSFYRHHRSGMVRAGVAIAQRSQMSTDATTTSLVVQELVKVLGTPEDAAAYGELRDADAPVFAVVKAGGDVILHEVCRAPTRRLMRFRAVVHHIRPLPHILSCVWAYLRYCPAGNLRCGTHDVTQRWALPHRRSRRVTRFCQSWSCSVVPISSLV